LLNLKNTGKDLSSNVLINFQKVSMSNGHIMQSYDQATFHKPETIHFCLSKNRYDERYLYSTDISVRYNRKTYAAKSVDFSRTGLGLIIKNTEGDSPLENEFLVDSHIKISFSNFMLKKDKTELKHISHRIVISRKTDNGLFLGVIRNVNLCTNHVNHFFAELVKQSKDTLELCVKDQTDNVYTAFYEAFFTKNIETIPMVIARDKTNHHYIREIGLTTPPCQLSDHFYLQGQGHDYRFLTSSIRLDELYQRTIRSTDKISRAFMLFIFKGKNKNGIENHYSVTDFELIDDEAIKKIVAMVLENNGACIQIQFINNLLIDKTFRKMTIEKVNLLNKSSAKLLSKEYNEMIGFAEMIDLTNEYRQQYQLFK
ncbi:MAG: hypothetical protein KAI17_27385, partial [Thiotrichaceae bacterium]|nr:hypothetical protein [Thiotrichaceae bacterium]